MDKLLSPKTLASAHGLAEQTIYNRHSSGGDLPPSIKLGRLLRFHPSAVEAWLASQTSRSVRPAAQMLGHVAKRIGRPTKAQQVTARGNY